MGEDNTKTELTDEKQSKPWLFKKGQSGNPNGRPEGSISIVTEIKKKLLQIAPNQKDGNKKTYLELLVERYFVSAIQKGDTRLITDIIDRIDGKALQKIQANVNNIEEELDKIDKTNYEQFSREAKKQMVEDEQPLQDQNQVGGDQNISS